MNRLLPRSFDWSVQPPHLLTHSRVKHELIRTYVRDYLRILTQVPRRRSLRLTLFDGFAGGGTFLSAGVRQSGTPLILAEEVIRAHAETNATRSMHYNVDLWAVEKDKANFESLKESLDEGWVARNFPGRIHVVNSDYASVLPTVLNALESIPNSTHRSIFLFDQTGFGQVPLDSIKDIFSRLQAPEVVLTFSVSWLADLAHNDPAFLSKVSCLGIKEAELGELLNSGGKKTRYGAQRWLRRHIVDYIGAPFNTCFFLRSNESHKDIWLLHFAKQWRARDAMMEVHYKLANKAHFYGKPGFDMLGYDPSASTNQLWMDLPDFNFTFDDAIASSNSLLDDLPRKLTDVYRREPVNLRTLFDNNLNDATLTYEQYQRGVVLARDNGLIEIVSGAGRVRETARLLDKSDFIALPRQGKLWSALY